MAGIALTVHHWYLLIAPLYFYQLPQDLSVSLNFSVAVMLPQHQAQWSQAGLSSVLELLCPEDPTQHPKKLALDTGKSESDSLFFQSSF